jgi:hypothetical protein
MEKMTQFSRLYLAARLAGEKRFTRTLIRDEKILGAIPRVGIYTIFALHIYIFPFQLFG